MPIGSRQGAALARIDRGWTHLESVLCAGVLALEVAAFAFWIALKGMSMGGGSRAGLVFRTAMGAIVVGAVAGRALRDKAPRDRSIGVIALALLGAVAGRVSADFGVTYFSNVLNWLQDSSFLTLLGGLRGVGTELTWWLAMLGASLATGTGRHINVDAFVRFVGPKVRLPAVLVGWVMAAVVCLAGVWGFFDHIAIGSFGAPANATASEKVSISIHEGGHHLFLLRKQLALDTRTAARVAMGERYDGWLRGAEWNAWIESGGWEEEFGPVATRSISLPATATDDLHPPLVLVPTGGYSRGLLTRDLHLVFPFGLLVIAIRFLLRALLVAMGRANLDSSAHGGGSIPPDEDATRAEADS